MSQLSIIFVILELNIYYVALHECRVPINYAAMREPELHFHVPEGAFLACNVPIVVCLRQYQLTDLLFRAFDIAELVDLQVELTAACTLTPGEHCDSHETLQDRHLLGQQGIYVQGRCRVRFLEHELIFRIKLILITL